LNAVQEDFDTQWNDKIWPEVVETGNKPGISPLEPPRRVAQQVHCDNFEGNSPTYFKRSVGLPTLASILGELRNRFGPKQIMVSRLLVIHPQNLITMPWEDILNDMYSVLEHFSKVTNYFKGDIFP